MVSQSERSYNHHSHNHSQQHFPQTVALRGGSGDGGPGGVGVGIGVAPRAPASVVSTGSARGSRARRYNRSHAGGGHSTTGSGPSPYAVPNEFPVFGLSGDVEIVIRVGANSGGAYTHEKRYLLHRHTLTRCSGFFEASTSFEWSKAIGGPVANPAALAESGEGASTNKSAQQLLPAPGGTSNNNGGLNPGKELARIPATNYTSGGELMSPGATTSDASGMQMRPGAPRKTWRYELDPGSGDGDIPMLVQKDPDEATPAPGPTSLFGPGGAGTGAGSGQSSRSKHSGGGAGMHSSSAAANHSFFRSVANLSLVPSSQSRRHIRFESEPPPQLDPEDEDLLRDYDNLFRIFYNYPPLLDGVNIADAYVQCKSLLTLADQYDALQVVGPRVDHHLLQFQSRLWKQIAKYPVSYLRLGYLARSRVIFQEALVHVVGQWPAGERSLRAALPDAVLDVIEDKVDELEEAVGRAEARLFRLGLTTARGERVTPQTSYLDWLAVSLFRQWLADNTSPPPPPPSSSGGVPPSSSRQGGRGRSSERDGRSFDSTSSAGPAHMGQGGGSWGQQQPSVLPLSTLGRTYRTLGSANPAAYLSHDECKRFLKLSPDLYSRDNLRRFEKRIDELKAAARELVRPLMGSGLELDVSAGGAGAAGQQSAGGSAIGYLTCTVVGDRDLPWGPDD